MYIIETRIKEAFDEYKESNHLNKLVHEIANVADYSVRSQGNAMIMYDAIKKYCPIPIYECIYYNGEEGIYHLLDFDPNGLDEKTLLEKIKTHLMGYYHINFDDLKKVMKNVYLLNVNMLVKII